MTQEHQLCAERFRDADVAAWRLGLLSTVEARRFDAHLKDCVHCQAHLEVLDGARLALRSQRPPVLRDRVWAGILTSIDHTNKGRTMTTSDRAPQQRTSQPPDAIGEMPATTPVRPMVQSRSSQAIVAVSATLIVVLLAAIIGHVTLGAGRSSGLATATATPNSPLTILPSYTPAPVSPTATAVPMNLPGWTSAGPPRAMDITFAPGTPTLAYACGSLVPLTSTNQYGGVPTSTNFAVWTSHDGGTTWSNPVQPAGQQDANGCSVITNPHNSQDVVLTLGVSQFGMTRQIQRSLDGGLTWQAVAPTITTGEQYLYAGDVAYTQNHLAILMAPTNGSPQVAIEEHTNQPWAIIPNATIFGAQSGTPSTINALLSVGDTLIGTAFTLGATPMSGSSEWIFSSHDGGQTWASQIISTTSLFTTLLGVGMDQRTLYATYTTPDGPQPSNLPDPIPLLRSFDLGRTWQALPTGGAGNFSIHGFVGFLPLALADGTVYAISVQSPASQQTAVYRLTPGATRWTELSPGFIGLLIAAQVDANGHLIRIWGHAGTATSMSNNNLPSGLQTFTPHP